MAPDRTCLNNGGVGVGVARQALTHFVQQLVGRASFCVQARGNATLVVTSGRPCPSRATAHGAAGSVAADAHSAARPATVRETLGEAP